MSKNGLCDLCLDQIDFSDLPNESCQNALIFSDLEVWEKPNES